MTPGPEPQDITAVDFFPGLQRLLDAEQLRAENQRLEQEVRKLEALWRWEQKSRQSAERQLKVALVALIGAMPPHCWPTAGRMIRCAWPGFREA